MTLHNNYRHFHCKLTVFCRKGVVTSATLVDIAATEAGKYNFSFFFFFSNKKRLYSKCRLQGLTQRQASLSNERLPCRITRTTESTHNGRDVSFGAKIAAQSLACKKALHLGETREVIRQSSTWNNKKRRECVERGKKGGLIIPCLYATCTSPIMHFFAPPPARFWHNLCFSFLS